MPRVLLKAGDEPERAIDVTRACTVGAGSSDDIPLTGVAERALLVAPAPGGVLIESRQRLTVAGRLVPAGTRRLLRRGERADADGWALWPDPSDADAEGTRALVGAALAGLPVTPVSGPGVLVLEGPSAGQRYAVTTAAVVGRGKGADVRLADPCASRRHLRLEMRGSAASVRDLGSKNGTAVRSAEGATMRERHVGRRRVSLRNGDEIEVGTTLLMYEDIVTAAPRGQRASASRLAGRITVVIASLALLAVAAVLARAAS